MTSSSSARWMPFFFPLRPFFVLVSFPFFGAATVDMGEAREDSGPNISSNRGGDTERVGEAGCCGWLNSGGGPVKSKPVARASSSRSDGGDERLKG